MAATGDLTKRLRRAERLSAVQAQMRRAAEWELTAIQRDAAALEVDRAALLAALGGDSHGHLFLEAANRRLRSLAARATELEEAAARQTEAVREQILAQKRAERGAERVAELLRRERERVEGIERLDGLALRRDASLP
jgi:hypothetical protein